MYKKGAIFFSEGDKEIYALKNLLSVIEQDKQFKLDVIKIILLKNKNKNINLENNIYVENRRIHCNKIFRFLSFSLTGNYKYNYHFNVNKKYEIAILFGSVYRYLNIIKKIIDDKTHLCYFANELPIKYRVVPITYKLMFEKTENKLLRKAKYIVCSNTSRKNFLKNNISWIKGKEIFVVHNYPNILNKNIQISENNRYFNKPNYFCYGGMIDSKRFSIDKIKLFDEFCNKNKTKILVAGPIKKNYKKCFFSEIEKRKNIIYLGILSKEKLDIIIRNSGGGIGLYYGKKMNNQLCAPQKIYDYLINRVPLICSENKPLINLVEKNKLGIILTGKDDLNKLKSLYINNIEYKNKIDLWVRNNLQERTIKKEIENCLNSMLKI